jgi:hypothetical protein
MIEKIAEGRARGHANLKKGPVGSSDPAGDDAGRTRDKAAEKFGVS